MNFIVHKRKGRVKTEGIQLGGSSRKDIGINVYIDYENLSCIKHLTLNINSP